MSGEARLAPALVTFAIAYIVLTIAFIVVQFFLPLDASMSIPVLIAAGIFTTYRFINAHKRPFTSGEKHKMALGSLLISLAVSIILLAGVALSAGGELEAMLRVVFQELRDNWHIFLLVLAGLLVLHWLALFLTYGWITRRLASRMT